MSEDCWIQLTQYGFTNRDQIIPKFTDLLEQDKIKWKIKSKIVGRGKYRKRRLALFRRPFEKYPPTHKQEIPPPKRSSKLTYRRGIDLAAHNPIEGKLERAVQEIIDYQLKDE